MHIKIVDLISNQEWIERLESFLHDSWISPQFEWDADSKRFLASIERLGYEAAEETLFLRVIRRFKLPRVPAELIVAPVQAVTDREGSKIILEERYYELEIIRLDPEANVLILGILFDRIHLVLGDNASIELRDTGKAPTQSPIEDIGRLVVKPSLIRDMLEADLS